MRLLAAVLLAVYLALVTCISVAARNDPPIEETVASPPHAAGDGSSEIARARTARLERQLKAARSSVRRQRRTIVQQRKLLVRRWRPTVTYALRLASAVSGISYWQLRTVAWCESRFYPFAVNGRYKGIFQMWWRPFGFHQFDPVASALSAAMTVRADGSWRQWACKP